MKLNLFIIAMKAPCGQRYLHQLRGTYTAKTSTMTIIANCIQKSGDKFEIPKRKSEARFSQPVKRIPWTILGRVANRVSEGLRTVKGPWAKMPIAFS
jgi:hypothetical protein